MVVLCEGMGKRSQSVLKSFAGDGKRCQSGAPHEGRDIHATCDKKHKDMRYESKRIYAHAQMERRLTPSGLNDTGVAFLM